MKRPIDKMIKLPVRSSLGSVRRFSISRSAVSSERMRKRQGCTLCGEGAYTAVSSSCFQTLIRTTDYRILRPTAYEKFSGIIATNKTTLGECWACQIGRISLASLGLAARLRIRAGVDVRHEHERRSALRDDLFECRAHGFSVVAISLLSFSTSSRVWVANSPFGSSRKYS